MKRVFYINLLILTLVFSSNLFGQDFSVKTDEVIQINFAGKQYTKNTLYVLDM